MKNSFVEAIKSNQEERSAMEEQSTPEQQDLTSQEDEGEYDDEGEEQEQESDISDDLRKQLSGKESFTKKIQEAQAQREAEEAAALEAEEAEEENEAEEKAEAEQEKEVQSFQVGEQTFNSIEEVNGHLQAKQQEYDELQTEVDEIRGFVEKISDPDMLEILKYVSQGYSARVAMLKAGLDESIFQIEADDEDAEALVRTKIERKQAIENQKKEQAKLEKNMQVSNEHFAQFKTEKGYDDQRMDSIVKAMTEDVQNTLNGLVSKRLFDIYDTYLNYDTNLKKAKEQGAIQGRNENITIQRKKQQGDSIPQLGRGLDNSGAAPAKRNKLSEAVNLPASSFLDIINKNRR